MVYLVTLKSRWEGQLKKQRSSEETVRVIVHEGSPGEEVKVWGKDLQTR